jgi:stearoyl-CoA desaturase (delta-9 desaturase)
VGRKRHPTVREFSKGDPSNGAGSSACRRCEFRAFGVMSLPEVKRRTVALLRWFDSYAVVESQPAPKSGKIDWLRCLPFVALHLACLTVFWVGASWIAIAVAIGLYWLRMFAITAFYHRYFSHRTFKTSRVMQFIFAAVAASSIQRGPLWWAAHHRLHHRAADTEGDTHSPTRHGFLWSHMGWFMTDANFRTRIEVVRDLAEFPELVLIDRYDTMVPILLGLMLYALGALLQCFKPELRTSGTQLVVWGLVISSVALMHATFTINSLAHRFGSRRYATRDESRNSLALALFTLGEGWHNNHHRYPGAARQGFFRGEIDLTYYVLRTLSKVGLVWDLRPVPLAVLEEGQSPPRSASTVRNLPKRPLGVAA